MTDRLSSFGYTFQVKVLSSLFKEKSFLNQIIDILDTSYFENQANQFIVDSIREYFQKYKTPPTMEVMKVKLDDVEDEVLKLSVRDQLKEIVKNMQSDDLEFIQEKTLEFCKNQKLKHAIMESVNLLKSGQYDDIKTMIDTALKAGADRDVGHEYKEHIEERYQESVRDSITTGWEIIDDITDGGLGSGELGVVVAPAGIGKSWLLANIGANAVKAGLRVVHYTLELNQAYVGLRYDSIFTGIPNQDLKNNIEKVKQKLSTITGELIIKYYPTKSATVNTISSHLEKCKLQGFHPDLIIVDYADLLRASKSNREIRHELGSIYETLRGLAGEHEIPVWTASQANRSALEDDTIGAEKISEDYSKIMTADYVMSLSRKLQDKVSGTGRIHVIKNRFGPDGITLPCKMNASNGSIEVYDGNSNDGKKANDLMKTGEEKTRKLLKNKFKELTGGA